jgi:hypothetical protein
MFGDEPTDQMLLASAPQSHGLSSFLMNATDGPEPHLLTPSAELVAEG